MGVVLWLLPPPEGLELQAWRLLAIFVATVAGIIARPLPMGAIAMIGLTVTLLTGTLETPQVLAGIRQCHSLACGVCVPAGRRFHPDGPGAADRVSVSVGARPPGAGPELQPGCHGPGSRAIYSESHRAFRRRGLSDSPVHRAIVRSRRQRRRAKNCRVRDDGNVSGIDIDKCDVPDVDGRQSSGGGVRRTAGHLHHLGICGWPPHGCPASSA